MLERSSTPSRTSAPSRASGVACCRGGVTCQSEFERYRRDRDRDTRNDLALRHEWLAVRHARSFRDRGQPVDDLTQVAWIGLIKAIERFDPGRGVGFPAFATPTIVGELKRHFRDHSWDLGVPRRAKEARTAISTGAEFLHHQLQRAPTPDELAAHLNIARDLVIETIAAGGAHRARSLDLQSGAESAVADVHQASWTDAAAARVETLAAMRQLDPRDRMILYWRFFDDCTQAQIAERIGVSQVQVSRRLSASCAELRRQIAGTSRQPD